MEEKKFWELIEALPPVSPDEDYYLQYTRFQNEMISEYLIQHGEVAIAGFHEILCRKVKDLYLPKIGELFLLTSYDLSLAINREFKYISVDGFVDFRAWIVSGGRSHYETFLNFTSEKDLLPYSMDANNAFREDLVYLALTVSERLGQDIDLNYDLNGNVEKLYREMNWDSLDNKYPQLFKLYQDRITNLPFE